MAAPHVAAAAALVLTTPISSVYDANLDGIWEPSEVQNKLQTTAKDLGGSGYDLLYGWGLVDAAAAVR
jgi:subtilisin family serine protease